MKGVILIPREKTSSSYKLQCTTALAYDPSYMSHLMVLSPWITDGIMAI